MTMLRCADMLTCFLILLLPEYSWAKQIRETRVCIPQIVIPGHASSREPGISRFRVRSLRSRSGMTKNRKHFNVKRPDCPDFHSRSRAARGELVSRQQPEDELAAGVRRAGDRTGDGGGVPPRARPPAAFAALLFHPAGRSADSDHLRGRAAARRQELFDTPGYRDPARQRDLLDHGVVLYRGQ